MVEMTDLSEKSPQELLRLYADILDELRRRGITRSSNNPVADIAEYLFCKAFGWNLEDNSTAHFDATGPDGITYQIKGRRLARENRSRQVSQIRGLDDKAFDFLAGVLFDHDFSILRAAIVPATVVKRRSTRDAHTNSFRFLLRDEVWGEPGVRDVTEELRNVRL